MYFAQTLNLDHGAGWLLILLSSFDRERK